jgi:hypothetical protein
MDFIEVVKTATKEFLLVHLQSDTSCLLIFLQLPKQTINQSLHDDRKLAIERKAAVVVTQTDLIV